MVEVGIPIYHSRKLLPNALDSLVAQTYKKFIVCLCADGDDEDYSDIIEEYKRRGLIIRFISLEQNGGPGMACQRIIDTTQCEYILFLDSDDLFLPRTVEQLYNTIKFNDLDLVRSSFIRQLDNEKDRFFSVRDNIITWRHGKIYKVKFLRDNDIRFLPELRVNEDAYFNIIVHHTTEKVGDLEEVLYIWKDNKDSITRSKPHKEYFLESYIPYIHGQVQALKKIASMNGSMSNLFIANTLIAIYYFYMEAKCYGYDLKVVNKTIATLKEEDWIQKWLNMEESWINIINNIKTGGKYDEKIVFFKESFLDWATRLIRKDM